MVQGIPSSSVSSAYPLQPAAGQAAQADHPPVQAAPAQNVQTLEIEIPMPAPSLDTQHLQAAGIEANQLSFEQMSTRILEEVGKVQRLDKAAVIVVKIGDRTLEIDATMLDKNKLQAALEKHFGASDTPGLGSEAHLASVQQIQD